MDNADLSGLVLNCLKDSKTIIDNYAYFEETDNDGLLRDCYRAKCYVAALSNYYSGNMGSLDCIIETLHSYYEPYVKGFEGETWDMQIGQKFTDKLFPFTAVSTLVTAFYSSFFPVALTMGTVSLVSYIYVKTRQWERGRLHRSFKRCDDEAKTITITQLSSLLDSEKEKVQEALGKSYLYPEEPQKE